MPLPLVSPVMTSQPASLVAVHWHPVDVVTAALPVAPSASTDALVGETENEQLAPAWVTVKTCPAMVKSPNLNWVPALGATA